MGFSLKPLLLVNYQKATNKQNTKTDPQLFIGWIEERKKRGEIHSFKFGRITTARQGSPPEQL